MTSLARWPLGAALVLSLFAGGKADAQGKLPKPESVTIETSDGVKLAGTFYPSGAGKKAPTALLLHNLTKGGNSHEDGWDSLAITLQKKDYAVLSFDFRGFGLSTQVNARQFWNAVTVTQPTVLYNRKYLIKVFAPANPPETIDQKDFPPAYYPVLTLDIAAAKAYLDRRNDGGDCNSSNFVLIGAGEGATLGLTWLASEWHRFKGVPPVGVGANPPLQLYLLDKEPEGTDQTSAIFLDLSSTLQGNRIPVQSYTKEAGLRNKVPMLFIYGKQDLPAEAEAQTLMQQIVPGFQIGAKRADNFSYTGAYGVPGTKLAGSKLLSNALPTEGYISKDYLDSVMEKKGSTEWRQRNFDQNFYFWNFTLNEKIPARIEADKAPRLLPMQRMGILMP
jgi:hypothetical protein